MKYDYKKHEKQIYHATTKPQLLTILKQQFLMIDGYGNPNHPDFSQKVSALFTLSYGIKMAFKKSNQNNSDSDITDYTVYPLESFWQQTNTTTFDKNQLQYTLMIKQPDFITEEMIDNAKITASKKKPHLDFDNIYFKTLPSFQAVQLLHLGSYDQEPASFAIMQDFMQANNLQRCSQSHQEIYLNNPQRVTADKLKTILRYHVK